MVLSVSSLLVLALCAATVVALGAGRVLRRRLRRPRLFQISVLATAAVLIPANTHCALHPAHPMLLLCTVVASLTALCAIAGLALALRIGLTPDAHPRRVLAIGAHPDDLELGCGGTLAKLADSGHEVRMLVMTRGGRGGDAGRRPAEASDGGRFLGAAELEVLDLPDTHLSRREAEMVQAIERLVRRHNPDIILTHSGHDQHQDHRAVHMATLQAARRHSAILCYESPSAMGTFSPSVFVDIEDYVEVKTTAVGAHRDQRGKPYMSPERVRGLAVHRGSQAKTAHAEGYEPVRLLASPLGEL